jgi:hypothetical protein
MPEDSTDFIETISKTLSVISNSSSNSQDGSTRNTSDHPNNGVQQSDESESRPIRPIRPSLTLREALGRFAQPMLQGEQSAGPQETKRGRSRGPGIRITKAPQGSASSASNPSGPSLMNRESVGRFGAVHPVGNVQIDPLRPRCGQRQSEDPQNGEKSDGVQSGSEERKKGELHGTG